MSVLRRVCGGLLLGLVVFPVYRLLYGREIGVIGDDVLLFTEQDRSLMVIGAPIALVLGLILARAIGRERIEGALARIGRALTSMPVHWFALAAAAFAAVYAAAFSLWVLDGKPNLIDAMAQLLHARFIAAGTMAGPADGWNEFWHIQNSLLTPHGWVSQYPPGHVVLLAAGFRLGAVWAVGPILCGVAVYFAALAAERLLPEDRAVARVGALLAAASPFFIAHAGAYMNHVSAAAMGAVAVYCGVRARDDASFGWALLAGVATGAGLTIRPLAAVVTAVTVAAIFAFDAGWKRRPLVEWSRYSLAAAVGALPFVATLAAYNAHFFGSPFRFGYTAAQGPAMGLGFHRDPWGNMYGIVEAIGFTSSDLTALSLHLLGSPIPVVLVAGLFLLVVPKLRPGERLIALWALLPVAANALYWHHGMFMGPRMLNESAPAWAILAAVSAAGLVRRIPAAWEPRGYSMRGGVAGALTLAALAGIFYLGPERLLQYRGWMASTRIDIPEVDRPATMFVHGGWTGRIAARLAAQGMRLDSLEMALTHNPTCAVHRFAEQYPGGAATGADSRPLDFTLRSGELPRMQISRGNWIRLGEGERLTPGCFREAASDTLGIVDIAALLWQGDLPGAPARGALIVRDMGPKANAALIAAHPARQPLVFARRSDELPPVLLPYDAGMQMLWAQALSSRAAQE
ncbi:MAG: glycosyltransferase family 39 protein [Gemmatimonadaceae bacterium]